MNLTKSFSLLQEEKQKISISLAEGPFRRAIFAMGLLLGVGLFSVRFRNPARLHFYYVTWDSEDEPISGKLRVECLLIDTRWLMFLVN